MKVPKFIVPIIVVIVVFFISIIIYCSRNKPSYCSSIW